MKFAVLALVAVASAQMFTDHPDSSYDMDVEVSWRQAKLQEHFKLANKMEHFLERQNAQYVRNIDRAAQRNAMDAQRQIQAAAKATSGPASKALNAWSREMNGDHSAAVHAEIENNARLVQGKWARVEQHLARNAQTTARI